MSERAPATSGASEDAPAAMNDAPEDGPATPRRDLGALIIPVVMVATGTYLVVGNLTMEEAGDGGAFGAQTFPWIVAAMCYALAVVLTIQALRPSTQAGGSPTDIERADSREDSSEDSGEDSSVDEARPARSNYRAVLTVVGAFLIFILGLNYLGWLISATLLFALVAVGLGNRSYLTCLLAGLGQAAAIQILFSGLLGVALPAGFLGGL